MINILTVDVEDWQQSTLDYTLPISERVLHSTNRLLDVFSEFNVCATFFIQSLVAEKYPCLVQRINAEGHEIASHGHSHIPLFELNSLTFAEDLGRSLDILSEYCNHAIYGYRAPDFSIFKDTLWALNVLLELGIQYSSSIFPIKGSRYGIPDAQLIAHEVIDGLIEVPLSIVRFAGRNLPIAGGGYLRIYPYWFTRLAIKKINGAGRPAVVYLHPYELDCQEMQQFRGRIPRRLYWSQSLNRHQTVSKLHSLLTDFEFAPIREVIAL